MIQEKQKVACLVSFFSSARRQPSGGRGLDHGAVDLFRRQPQREEAGSELTTITTIKLLNENAFIQIPCPGEGAGRKT